MENNTHYETSDGERFYKKNDADNYARSLKDRTVKPVAASGMTEIAETIDQPEVNDIPVKDPVVINANEALSQLNELTGGKAIMQDGKIVDPVAATALLNKLSGNEPSGNTDNTPEANTATEKVTAVKEPVKKATTTKGKTAAQGTKTTPKNQQPAKQKKADAAVKTETKETAPAEQQTTTNTEAK